MIYKALMKTTNGLDNLIVVAESLKEAVEKIESNKEGELLSVFEDQANIIE